MKRIKIWFAKLFLNIFADYYKINNYQYLIKKNEEKLLEASLDEIVMKDDEWHNVAINFRVKENDKDVFVDNTKFRGALKEVKMFKLK